jgi:cytochrome d ubiquinol oxidase subunit II
MLIISPDFRARWLAMPAIVFAAPVPLLVLALGALLWRSLGGRRDWLPFLAALGLFLLSYVGLGISLWPFIVPPAITIWDAANPPESQIFLLVGAAVLVPVILAYTATAYWLFRGKVREGEGYH